MNENQIDDYSGIDLTASGSIVFQALVEGLNYSISPTPLTEENINGAEMLLTLVGDEFADASLNPGNFILNKAPAGISIGSIQYNSPTTATVKFAYLGTDFDVDSTHVSLTINAAELLSGGNIISSLFTIATLVEMPSIVLSDNGISESMENIGKIYINLSEDEFISSFDISQCTIENLPNGVTIGTVTRISATQIELQLDGTRNIDYDNDITNFSISIPATLLVTGLSTVSASTGVRFIANNDDESITLSTININEGEEDGQNYYSKSFRWHLRQSACSRKLEHYQSSYWGWY